MGVEVRCPLCINRCWVAFIWRRAEQTDLRAEHGTHDARVSVHAHWKQTSGFSLEACARVRSTSEPLPVAAYDADADRCRCVWGCSVCVCVRISNCGPCDKVHTGCGLQQELSNPSPCRALMSACVFKCSQITDILGVQPVVGVRELTCGSLFYIIFCFLPTVQMKLSQFLPISGLFHVLLEFLNCEIPCWNHMERTTRSFFKGKSHNMLKCLYWL